MGLWIDVGAHQYISLIYGILTLFIQKSVAYDLYAQGPYSNLAHNIIDIAHIPFRLFHVIMFI